MSLPPYYILYSHSPLSAQSSNASANTIGHPLIQYHFANDSPAALWPQHPNEHVLVLDYDPTGAKPPTVQSMSKDLTVTSLKIEEAPGAAAANENDPKNDRMYTIETTTSDGLMDSSPCDRDSAYTTVMRFKARNTILRRTLLYPDATASKQPAPVPPQSPPPFES